MAVPLRGGAASPLRCTMPHDNIRSRPRAKRMSTLICLGLGYCAEHYVARHGTRFARVGGTTRDAERAAALSARVRHVEAQVFDGANVSDALKTAAGAT